jgi:glutamyl-tRNA reductase
VTRELTAIMDAVMRDARDIRTRYLQGIGGHSYATLARRLLDAAKDARVLIVGHGALGRSMVPKLANFRLALFNRTRPVELLHDFQHVFAAGEEAAGTAWATHVLLCVPRLDEIDRIWVSLLRGRQSLQVVHLGCRRNARGPWSEIERLRDLDDLFDLEQSQSQLRAQQVEQAREACAELAVRFETGLLRP